MDHARHPHNLRVDEEATVTGMADLGGRPPKLAIYLRVQDGIVESASFQAAGCGISIACGSVLTDLIVGKTTRECTRLEAETLAEALEGIPAYKMYCAHVAIGALRDALAV